VFVEPDLFGESLMSTETPFGFSAGLFFHFLRESQTGVSPRFVLSLRIIARERPNLTNPVCLCPRYPPPTIWPLLLIGQWPPTGRFWHIPGMREQREDALVLSSLPHAHSLPPDTAAFTESNRTNRQPGPLPSTRRPLAVANDRPV
jgi:hypothetical protein